MLTEIATVQAEELAKSIQQAWISELQMSRSGQRGGGAREYMYAGGYSPCPRAMLYAMTKSHELPPFDAEVLARMERGNERERDMLIYLTKAGQHCDPPFSLVSQQQRFELKDRRGRVAIVGKVDARLKFSSGVSCPLECKAWSAFLVDRIDTFEDCFRNQWTQKGAMQILCYLFGASEPVGFLLLDRAGLPKLIPVELDKNWDRVDEFLLRAENAIDHLRAGTEPDYLNDSKVCKSCDWYGSHCNPPLLSSSNLGVITDPYVQMLLDRREELKHSAGEYAALDKEVKVRLKGVEQALAGNYLIEGKEVERKAYSVNASKYWTLDITKV